MHPRSKLSKRDTQVLESLIENVGLKFRIESFLFQQQTGFVKDPHKRKIAVTTRRSGKSTSCAAHLIETALSNPNSVSLYVTLTRTSAKKLIWPLLKQIISKYGIDARVNETDLSIQIYNGAYIYLAGASDKGEIEKFRGLSLILCYLDEAQSFPPFIEDLVDDIISPALLDNDGTLVLIGTPGPVPSGYFYNCSQSKGWSKHFWSMFDNPFIKLKSGKEPRKLLEEELERRGVSENDPKIQREYFGKWILDLDSLVFKYNPNINDFDTLPQINGKWSYVFGIDLGFNDADAIAVLAYSDASPNAYLVEEVVHHKQGITELMEQLQGLIVKYNPEKMVVDTGGLGKKIAEELTRRHSIPLVAADKVRKYENIELLNDALRTRKLFIRSNSRFSHDSKQVEWDVDKKTPERLKISDRYHSDICDAVLYGFKAVYHWLYRPEPVVKKLTHDEYLTRVERELEEYAEQRLQAEQDADNDFYGGGV